MLDAAVQQAVQQCMKKSGVSEVSTPFPQQTKTPAVTSQPEGSAVRASCGAEHSSPLRQRSGTPFVVANHNVVEGSRVSSSRKRSRDTPLVEANDKRSRMSMEHDTSTISEVPLSNVSALLKGLIIPVGPAGDDTYIDESCLSARTKESLKKAVDFYIES